jgi:hypothetical protein
LEHGIAFPVLLLPLDSHPLSCFRLFPAHTRAQNKIVPAHPRLPIKFFHDPSFGGSLCQILRTALQCKQDLNLKRIDYSERFVEQFEEMMLRVEGHLVVCMGSRHMFFLLT